MFAPSLADRGVPHAASHLGSPCRVQHQPRDCPHRYDFRAPLRTSFDVQSLQNGYLVCIADMDFDAFKPPPAPSPDRTPDSAIQMTDNDDTRWPTSVEAVASSPELPPPPPPRAASRRGVVEPVATESAWPAEQIDDLLAELHDQLPSRPPTPPPRSAARNRSSSIANSPTVASISDRAMSEPVGVAATAESETPGVHRRQSSRFSRFLQHIRGAPSTSTTTTASIHSDRRSSMTAPSSASTVSDITTTESRSAVDRRASRNSFFMVRGWKAASKAADPTEPDAVFGVSLHKSIRVASLAARTHHAGSRSASQRQFPLCVFTCHNYIRGDDGLDTPGLFEDGGSLPPAAEGEGEEEACLPSQQYRVLALRDLFAGGPAFGAELDLAAAGFSRRDAAALILLFLANLPRPLVSEAVARHWLALSRQATVPGAYDARRQLDQCIDFWEEALGGGSGIRDDATRSLLKLLLNLWGDIADAADRNGMTAERLARRVVRPLMQLDRGSGGGGSNNKGRQGETDYMLSLAFIIRKRSEYTVLLRGGGRKSNAAFEA